MKFFILFIFLILGCIKKDFVKDTNHINIRNLVEGDIVEIELANNNIVKGYFYNIENEKITLIQGNFFRQYDLSDISYMKIKHASMNKIDFYSLLFIFVTMFFAIVYVENN